MSATEVPAWAARTLAAGQYVELEGIKLRPPTRPGTRGASGAYRIEWYCPVTGDRRERSATDLTKAWLRTVEQVDANARVAEGLNASGPRTSTPLGEVAAAYLHPDHNARWGPSRRATVTSIVTNWIVGHDIDLEVGGIRIAAADLAIGELTAARAERLLKHVYRKRAYRTYLDVNRELKTLLRWAAREGYLPRDTDVWDHIGTSRPPDDRPGVNPGTLLRPVEPDEIPPMDAIDALRVAARDDEGHRGAVLVDVLAFAGPRIGEALALGTDPESMPFDDHESVYRPRIWRQVHKSTAGTRPPKHGRERHAWIPPWMTDDVAKLIAASDDKLFPAPRGDWWPTDRFRVRRFDRWMTAAGWPQLPDDDPRQRVWKWTAHSLRHSAASWMLNDLGLAPDDVAAFLGHRDGHQVWKLYSRVRPGLVGRASTAAIAAGDPRG